MQECNVNRLNCRILVALFSLLWTTYDSTAQQPTAADAATAYAKAIESGLYAEAEVAAKVLLDIAIRDGTGDDLAKAALLYDLALAQQHNENYEAALQNYELAIDIIEANTDRLNLALIEPLLGIGATHVARNRPDLALNYLERALHVRHVNTGPHSLEQTDTLETLLDAYSQMGDLRQSIDVADRLVNLYSRKYPGKSMELVPALLQKGQILGEAGDRREERNAYNEAIKIVEHNEGNSSVNLARPLIRLGQSHQSEYFDLYLAAELEQELPDPRLLSEAESYLESALELARQHNDVDWQITNEALLALGDFYTLSQEPGRARLLYRDAWQLLSVDLTRINSRRHNLETVVPLLQPVPDLTVGIPSDAEGNPSTSAYETGFIVTQFTVTRRGRLTDIGLVEISPERNEKIEAEIKRVLTLCVFRPRFENGFVVDTPNQMIRYEFPYTEDR